jgi:hypothetical protein
MTSSADAPAVGSDMTEGLARRYLSTFFLAAQVATIWPPP